MHVSLCVTWFLFPALTEITDAFANLNQKIRHMDTAGQFEWVDSTLVRAITDGHWCVISNANLCKYVFFSVHVCMCIGTYRISSIKCLLLINAGL